MSKKNTTHILRISLYGILGLAFLAGGILYARFEKRWIAGALPNNIGSQFINNFVNQTPETPTMSPDKIRARIDQLEAEIVQETNDPDRALALRREVQKLRAELQELE